MIHPVTSQRWPRTNYLGFFNGFQVSDLSVPPRNPANPPWSPPSPSILAFFDGNRVTRTADIKDGTSNTMAMAEGLAGGINSYRGMAWGDGVCECVIFTELAPNSRERDRCYPSGPPYECEDLPEMNRPAEPGDGNSTDTCGSRSMHPGGVQVLLGDGACRFVNETIAIATWRALATIRGGEPISGDY